MNGNRAIRNFWHQKRGSAYQLPPPWPPLIGEQPLGQAVSRIRKCWWV